MEALKKLFFKARIIKQKRKSTRGDRIWTHTCYIPCFPTKSVSENTSTKTMVSEKYRHQSTHWICTRIEGIFRENESRKDWNDLKNKDKEILVYNLLIQTKRTIHFLRASS